MHTSNGTTVLHTFITATFSLKYKSVIKEDLKVGDIRSLMHFVNFSLFFWNPERPYSKDKYTLKRFPNIHITVAALSLKDKSHIAKISDGNIRNLY